MVYRVLELVLQVALLLLTARFLEPAGRGLYALASFATAVLSLPLASVWSANAMEVARRRTPMRQLLGTSLVIAIVGGAAIGLVALAFSLLIGDRWWVLAIPAAITPFVLLGRYQEGFYRAVGHVSAPTG